jgi:hypothetical protein
MYKLIFNLFLNLPNSSIKTKEFSVDSSQITFVSSISIKKVDFPSNGLSDALKN